MRDLPLDADVAQALGGPRLIAEELRGDLVAARRAADRALEVARRGHDAAELARAAAQAGAVALLQGEPSTAVAALADSLAAEPDGPVAETTRTLVGLALDADRLLFADGAEAASLSLTLRALLLSEEVGPVNSGFLGALARARRAVTDAHLAGHGPERLETALGELRAATPSGWDAFAALAAADLTRRAGLEDEAEERRTEALALYAQAADRAGVALCELTRADWWLAAPPASGLTWGVDLREGGPGVAARVPLAVSPADSASARAALERARAGFEQAGAPRGLAAVLLRESYLAILHGEGDARTPALHARDRFQAAGDGSGARVAEGHACLADIAAGRPFAGLDAARAIGAWGGRTGPFALVCGIGLQLAGAGHRWRDRGELDTALAAYRLAFELFKSLGHGFGGIDALADRAAIHDAVGEAATACDLLEEASAIAAELLGVVPTRLNGPVITRAESSAVSLRQILHTLEDADRLDRLRTGSQAVRAAMLETLRLQAPAAVPGLERVYAEGDAQDLVTADVYRAWRALERDAPSEHQTALDAALTKARTVTAGGPWLEMLVRLAMNELDEARHAFGRVLAERDAAGGHPVLQELTEAVQVEDWATARARLDALEAERGPGWAEREPDAWRPLAETARVLAAEEAWPAALERFDAALADLSRRQPPVGRGEQRAEEVTTTWAAGGVAVHAAHACLAAASAGAGARQELEWRAFAALEGRKARRLLELATSGAAAAALYGTAGPDVARWRELTASAGSARERLARAEDAAGKEAARAALEAARGALGELESELRAKDSRWIDVLHPRIAPPEPAEICSAIPEGTALLHYSIAAGQLIAMAITRDGIASTHRASVSRRRLAADIARFRVLCAAGESERWRRLGGELGALLLGPLEPVLAEHEHLWIVPSQAAHALPFCALLRDDRPLVDTHVTTVLPNAGLAVSLGREPRPLDGPALFAGDPEGMVWPGRPDDAPAATSDENALPWAAAEVAAGAARFGVDPLLGPEATEVELRARLAGGRLGLAFLATHGSFEDPALASVLLLAHGEWLSVFEMLGLGLDVELMVLSACESGRTVVRPGDELQGFPAAVLAAGVRSSLTTLWSVSDGGTAVLMRDLVARLADGKEPRSALAEAQRRLPTLEPAEIAEEAAQLRAAAAAAGRPLGPAIDDPPHDLSHPRYWAPFVLFGR